MSRSVALAGVPYSPAVRDEWEANKARYEAAISDILDESWTIEVDPLVIAPYNEDRPGQLGSIING